jgi:hypothetical protein
LVQRSNTSRNFSGIVSSALLGPCSCKKSATLNQLYVSNQSNGATAAMSTTGTVLIQSFNLSSLLSAWANNSSVISSTSGTPHGGSGGTFDQIGYTGAVSTGYSEHVLWLTDKSSDRVAIKNNISAYFGGI